MQNHRFEPPTAEVRDIREPAVRVRRPVSVWLLQIVLAAFTLAFFIVPLTMVVDVWTRKFPGVLAAVVVMAVWVVLLALCVAALLCIHRRWIGSRWLCLAGIVGLAGLIHLAAEDFARSIGAEHDGGLVTFHGLMLAVCLWWAHAAAFSRKARAYFSKGRG